jgi:hypothetical protein
VGLAAQLGASGAGTAAAAGKTAWLSSSLAKVVSALALLSATGAGVYVVAHVTSAARSVPAPSAARAAPVVSVSPMPSGIAESAPVPVSTSAASQAVLEKPAASSRAAGTSVSAPSVVNAETLAEETRLLRDADQALRAGNAARALGLLDEHAAQFPRGVLAPERSAERLIARCKLGQAGAKVAQAYLSAHANSAFAARIRDACSLGN